MKILTIVLTCLFVLLPCLNSYADDAEELINAATEGDILTVKDLIAKGVDVNARNTSDGETVLMRASKYGHLDVVQALLAKGADVNAKDCNGQTALMWASLQGHLDIVQALLAKGADVNAKANNGETALSNAKEYGRSEITQLLIKAGATEEKNVSKEAIASLKRIYAACESFRMSQNPPRYPPNLKTLSEATPPYIDSQLGNGEKEGYKFIYTQISATQYTCSALPKEPGITGGDIYFVDESGVIRLNNASGNPVE